MVNTSALVVRLLLVTLLPLPTTSYDKPVALEQLASVDTVFLGNPTNDHIRTHHVEKDKYVRVEVPKIESGIAISMIEVKKGKQYVQTTETPEFRFSLLKSPCRHEFDNNLKVFLLKSKTKNLFNIPVLLNVTFCNKNPYHSVDVDGFKTRGMKFGDSKCTPLITVHLNSLLNEGFEIKEDTTIILTEGGHNLIRIKDPGYKKTAVKTPQLFLDATTYAFLTIRD